MGTSDDDRIGVIDLKGLEAEPSTQWVTILHRLKTIGDRLSNAVKAYPKEEKVLAVVIFGYMVLFLIYTISNIEFLFTLTLVTGPVLAFLIPELASKQLLLVRLLLTCVPIICVAIGQQLSDHQTDRKLRELREQLRESTESSKEFAQQQAIYTERIIINPGSIANGMKNGNRGFSWKSHYLTLDYLLAEAKVLNEFPIVRSNFVRSPSVQQAEKELFEWSDRPIGDTSADQSLSKRLVEIQIKKSWASEYEALAKFVIENGDTYSLTEHLADVGDVIAAAHQLQMLSDKLKAKGLGLTAGYYSQLGTLALGSRNREQALALLYQGLGIDESHIPLYESLAYTLWAFNHDVTTSLEYIGRGMALTEGLISDVNDKCAATDRLISDVAKAEGDRGKLYDTRLVQVKNLCDSIKVETERYAKHFLESFKNMFVINSAIAIKNEADARRYAKELRDKYPDDIDYAENAAFVVSRFDWSRDKLLSAARCMLTVKRLATEPILKDMTGSHYDKLAEKIRRLGISEGLIPVSQQDTLSTACSF